MPLGGFVNGLLDLVSTHSMLGDSLGYLKVFFFLFVFSFGLFIASKTAPSLDP
jgi:hypothetical protein